MKDEGFLTAAGVRFVLAGAVLIVAGVAAYFLLAEDISIDLDELTGPTTTESTTEVDVPEVTIPEITTPEVPNLADDPYFKCISRAETAEEIVACGDL